MSDAGEITIHTDGAARGNPGPAAFAYVIEQPGKADIEESGRLGETTNNVAEYEAVVRALEHARQLGGKKLRVLSDSELLVKQMNGQYKVRNQGLRPIFEKASALRDAFARVAFQHIPREQNGRADRLCNEALDGGAGPRGSRTRREKPKAADRNDLVQHQAIECLRTMAHAWARGNPQEPKPEDVWEQLWSILEDGGVLRAVRNR